MSRPDTKRLSIAIEVFVKGHAEVRSRAWPCLAELRNGVWVLRDAERRNPKNYRKEEWISLDCKPEQVHSQVLSETRGHYFIGVMVPEPDNTDETKNIWKKLGYRLLMTEPFFVHSLKRIPRITADVEIRQMRTQDDAVTFARFSGTKLETPDRYEQDSWRQYLAFLGEELVGCVRSVETAQGNWCTNLFVKPEVRRQGIGSALMAQMLRDDRSRRASQAVLLATHTGALLYPQVGYERLGTLLIFAPKKPTVAATE